jgi:very-short-patch-repair endonuclease
VLAGGDGAVISHFSAAGLWGIRDDWPALPEITVPVKRCPTGIRVHVHPTLDQPKDVRRHRSIPVTSPARTLLDIAPRLTELALARAVNEARLRSGLRRSHLAALLARQSRHPGARPLRPFVELSSGPTRSEFEDRFLELARDYRLPTPLINVSVCGFEVDVYFPERRVIVELDGWDFHQTRRSLQRDRERDAVTLAAGIVTVRITWERLTQVPDREAARLRAILEARS